MKKTLLAACLSVAFFLPSAEAGVFDFSFTLTDNRVLSGKIDGTIQADNNTVLVNSILDFASFDGSPLPSMTSISAYGKGDSPLLSFDGSIMDLATCFDVNCQVGLGFGRIQPGIGFYFDDYYQQTNVRDFFNPANWSLTSSSESVPVPTALPLMVMGGIFMAFRRRKAA